MQPNEFQMEANRAAKQQAAAAKKEPSPRIKRQRAHATVLLWHVAAERDRDRSRGRVSEGVMAKKRTMLVQNGRGREGTAQVTMTMTTLPRLAFVQTMRRRRVRHFSQDAAAPIVQRHTQSLNDDVDIIFSSLFWVLIVLELGNRIKVTHMKVAAAFSLDSPCRRLALCVAAACSN